MDILALYPQEPETAVFEKMPPLGMLWVATALKRAGRDVQFFDYQVDEVDPGRLAADHRPRLALIGGTSHSRFVAFEAAAAIKQASPDTVVVFGGPHATFTAADTLTHIPSMDLVVHGEGEETAVELAAWAIDGGAQPGDLARIAGISYRDGGHVVRTADRPTIHDLDALGPPDRSLLPMARYRMEMDYLRIPGASVMTARGCPINCTFCSASAMFGKSYRWRSAKSVVDEIEDLLTHHGAQGIKIFDSTFTLKRSHAEEICAEMKRRGINVPWECEIRVGSVDRPLLERMREVGCYYVDIGVESGSQRVLDECIEKRIELSKAEELLRWTQELGFRTKVFFTLGHPGETYAEARQTNRYIWKHRKYIHLAAYHAGISIYPGTPVADYAREQGLMPAGFSWSTPYRNLANQALFRAVDTVPLLLQPAIGLKGLRRLRLQFILMRLASPRFVWGKLTHILRKRTIGDYFTVLRSGAATTAREASR